MLVLVNGTLTKRDETSTYLKSEALSHWCKNVTSLLKRKNSEGEREEGLLHKHLRQWLIIIIMRQISRPTEGLYEPPTLHIYFSFSLLLLPTSCVWPFSQLISCLYPDLRHIFSTSSPLHIIPSSCFSSCSLPSFPVLSKMDFFCCFF